MISLEEVSNTIKEIESEPLTLASVGNLAALYIVRDKAKESRGALQPVKLSGSEFLEACSDVDMTSLFSILDEHMDAIKAIHPREYMALIQKIRLLHSI